MSSHALSLSLTFTLTSVSLLLLIYSIDSLAQTSSSHALSLSRLSHFRTFALTLTFRIVYICLSIESLSPSVDRLVRVIYFLCYCVLVVMLCVAVRTGIMQVLRKSNQKRLPINYIGPRLDIESAVYSYLYFMDAHRGDAPSVVKLYFQHFNRKYYL